MDSFSPSAYVTLLDVRAQLEMYAFLTQRAAMYEQLTFTIDGVNHDIAVRNVRTTLEAAMKRAMSICQALERAVLAVDTVAWR